MFILKPALRPYTKNSIFFPKEDAPSNVGGRHGRGVPSLNYSNCSVPQEK